jgi:hypothetical protein
MNTVFKHFNRLLYGSVFVLAIACHNRDGGTDSDKFKVTLHYAGKNASEITKVIEHYSGKSSDSLKLKSAYFLINNMIGKGYWSFKEVNNAGICNYDIFRKGTGIEQINRLKKRYEDSLGKGEIKFIHPVFCADLESITYNELVENIEYAFKAWQLPWAKQLTFEQFEEFILPYRVEDEPLQNWRKYFFDHREWITQQIINSNDRIKIACIVNDSLKRCFKFIHDNIQYYPGSLSVKQLYATRGGRCADLNMIAGYMMRAIGIPIASEFTPYWGNTNHGGHSWLSVLDTTGKFVPMNPAYDNPIRDSLTFTFHLAKAYRNKYEINPTFYKDNKNFKYYYDITNQYLPVINYSIKINPTIKDSICLGVLNGTYWKPLKTEIRRLGNSVTFVNIGKNILYIALAIDTNGHLKTVSKPFFIYKNGTSHQFHEIKNKLIKISFNTSGLINTVCNKNCQIIYWDNQLQNWIPTGDFEDLDLMHKTIDFNNVISDAVYRVIDSRSDPQSISYGRPFIYNEEVHKWTFWEY